MPGVWLELTWQTMRPGEFANRSWHFSRAESWSEQWEELGFWRVFEDQEALEPGESASEEVLLEIPDADYAALKLELWVHSAPDEVPWKGTAVVNLLSEGDNDPERDPGGSP